MSDVLVTQSGSILEVLFNRPEKKNALTRAMYAAVVDAFRHADGDASIRVVLLSGVGDTFTSGNDIKDFQDRASMNGAAIGVGTTMLAHADLVIAARSARFAMPFTSLGLVPEAASSLLFPRLVGHQRASALLLFGEALDAETACEWGLVNQVVADQDLMTTARAIAARLAALPPVAVRQTKNLIKNGRDDVPGRIEEELALFRERLCSPEAAEAFAAFVEKRKPDFSKFS
jgi:enoyl-CoA hydratase/carnithine racemase